jgi:hypothetical protein
MASFGAHYVSTVTFIQTGQREASVYGYNSINKTRTKKSEKLQPLLQEISNLQMGVGGGGGQ